MFADMDKLKYINDHFGHEYGDLAIKLVSGAILHNIPETSIPVRMGGDEFLIMNKVISQQEADEMIQKIQSEIRSKEDELKLPCEISFSIGWIVTDMSTEKSLDDYVKEADEIMYQQKYMKKVNREE